MTTSRIEIPKYINITVSKAAEVQSVVRGNGQKFYPGKTVELTIGEGVDVWTSKGRKPAVVTDRGFVLTGLHADGSKVS